MLLSSAVFGEDRTRGPGNEIQVHPWARGRYRVCYEPCSQNRVGSLEPDRGRVLWKGGSVGIAEVSLAGAGVELVVDGGGNMRTDAARTGETVPFFGEAGGCR